VHANAHKAWDYYALCKHRNFTWDIITEHILANANAHIIEPHLGMTHDGVDGFYAYLFEAISQNPNITWEIVEANPEWPWDYPWLSGNPNITWEIVQANPDKNWCFEQLGTNNPNITWDIIDANPDAPWDYHKLSWKQIPAGTTMDLSLMLK
jgi:hypothetical protein